MACTGHTNECLAHGGYIPGVTPTSWTDDPLIRGTIIKQQHWEELHNALNTETTRRSETWAVGDGDPGPVSAGDPINSGDSSNLGWVDLRNQISYLSTGTWDGWQPNKVDQTSLVTSALVSGSSPQVLRDKTNTLEAECACDCNYACTCDCNYCTCDCNYCTCNCQYTCTCDCDYGGGSK